MTVISIGIGDEMGWDGMGWDEDGGRCQGIEISMYVCMYVCLYVRRQVGILLDGSIV